MKTKQQILEHLAQVGYAKTEAPKIAGWLVAKEITKVGEKVVYTDGEKSFGEFLDWYNESWVDEVNRIIKALNPFFTLLEDNGDFETMAKLISEPIKREFEMNATSSDNVVTFSANELIYLLTESKEFINTKYDLKFVDFRINNIDTKYKAERILKYLFSLDPKYKWISGESILTTGTLK